MHNSKIVLYGYYVGTIRAKQGLNTKEFSALFYDFPQGHGDEMSIKEMREDIINAILNVWGIVKCTMLPFDMKLLPEIITILHPAGANH